MNKTTLVLDNSMTQSLGLAVTLEHSKQKEERTEILSLPAYRAGGGHAEWVCPSSSLRPSHSSPRSRPGTGPTSSPPGTTPSEGHSTPRGTSQLSSELMCMVIYWPARTSGLLLGETEAVSQKKTHLTLHVGLASQSTRLTGTQ